MDEQNSEGQRPDFWGAWTSSADQADGGAGQPAPRSDQPDAPAGAQGEPGGYSAGDPAAAGGQPSMTQPIGAEQPGWPGYGPGYGQPGQGYGQPGQGYGYPPPGYGQGSYSGPGYGQPGGYNPGGYNPGGYGPPPGSYPPEYGGYGQPPRRRHRLASTAIAYLAVAAVAATAGGLAVAFANNTGSPPPASSTNPGGSGSNLFPFNGNGNGGTGNGASVHLPPGTLSKVKKAVTPGLVIIASNLKYAGNGAAAFATGMIISSNGLVLTNNHVINGTTGLQAKVVSTGKTYTAKWIGYDKGSDVAVIRLVNASGLPTVPLGNSSTVKIGDDVVGMGNANGAGHISYVTGMITNVNQSITASDNGSGIASERLTGMLQTNAQIVRGDSGGPLVSTDGKVIGMDTAASAGAGANTGQDIGFAIPINKAMAIAKRIINGQSGSGVQIGQSGFLGVLVPSGPKNQQSTATSPRVQLRQEEQANQSFGQINPAPRTCVQTDQSPGVPRHIAPVPSGTLVLGSLCNTPAAAAGLSAGDVITRVNSQAISSPSTLMHTLLGIHSGTKITLTWVTPSDQTVSHSLTLAPAPPQ